MPLIKRLDDTANEAAYYTPTKCGTVTAIKVLESLGWEFTFGDRHSMHSDLAPTRYMQVRHPLDRWCSMWWAIRRWVNSGQHPFLHWAATSDESIRSFADAWAEKVTQERNRYARDPVWRQSAMYTWNLSENWHCCAAQRFFKMEELEQVMMPFFHDLADEPACKFEKTPHLNKTRDRPTVRETLDLLLPSQVDIIREWARPDCELFHYDMDAVN